MENDLVPVEDRSTLSLLDSTSDFVFCITSGLLQKLSSVDELFSNGKIVPMKIKPDLNAPDSPHQPQESYIPPMQPATTKSTEKKTLKEFLSSSSDEAENEVDKPSSKYFKQFKRSSSLNFNTTHAKNLTQLLHFLSRSNSTGSAPNPIKRGYMGKSEAKVLETVLCFK
ncbi:unnamed protein product [Lupinus luteus]|uniref:Uncharacterized protein n=1 Tax=Lupinus luteus TaxID=3873 RepID=A0AAV1YEE0_LUPLU